MDRSKLPRTRTFGCIQLLCYRRHQRSSPRSYNLIFSCLRRHEQYCTVGNCKYYIIILLLYQVSSKLVALFKFNYDSVQAYTMSVLAVLARLLFGHAH